MHEMLCLHRSYKGRHCGLLVEYFPTQILLLTTVSRLSRGVCQQLCLNKDCKAVPPKCAADLETNTTKQQ